MSSFESPQEHSWNRKGQKLDGKHLLNFKTAGPPPSSSRNRNKQRQHHHSKKLSKKKQQETWEEAQARKSLSGFFFLHSSASHSFAITRRSLVSESVISSSSTLHNYGGPDVGVRWEAVRMVKCYIPNACNNSKTKESAAVTNLLESMAICPICLDEFIAPRITKCGHVFSLPCILRHVYSKTNDGNTQKKHDGTDRSISKCPCCFEEIHIDQLRPIVFETVQPPQHNRVMSFTRLHRMKGCYTPYLPHAGGFKRVEQFSAPSAADEDASFCRFNYVDSKMLLKHLESELTLLQSHLNGNCPYPLSDTEKSYYLMATEVVTFQRDKTMREMEEESHLASIDVEERLQHPIVSITRETLANSTNENRGKNEFMIEEQVITLPEGGKEQNNIEKNKNKKRNRRKGRTRSMSDSSNHALHPKNKDLVYLGGNCSHFYQASDGQLCFLSKLNMNCLAAEFATSNPLKISNECVNNLPLPDVIEGQVVECETVHLTPEIRNRMSFLSHLPLYTDIQFVEIDLNRILSDETKAKFKNEIDKRRKIRKNKAINEKKADRRAKKKEEDRINALKAAYPMIDPDDEFFHSPILNSRERSLSEDIHPSLVDESFGPALVGSSNVNTFEVSNLAEGDGGNDLVRVASKTPVISFRNACVQKNAFPSLGQSMRSSSIDTSTTYFPPLGTPNSKLSSSNNKAKPKWGSVSSPSTDSIMSMENLKLGSKPGKSGGKGKKVVLFSTGGQRGR